ncbi:flagellar basal body rod protein FlgF (plasmid) [Sphingomonas paeninsulae]|uniref:Flagellar basal-body rod protein FlgF n=1 Tax=Sphingomonas paeninsulae TaxID=2319844 RepID=A0A494TDT4_SPHPE|nr:flagellar basal body rod protein FlgF [Sphingomonas paeninsulae]AYJ85213.1 flagellar basal body rod protein FlgF [Sphingomonas paeninsulae]
MDKLIHTSLSALRSAMARQAVTASNLANASTTGFRAEMASVRPVWLTGAGLNDRAFASEEVVSADMQGGTITQTGRPLDVALQGDALLSVQAEDGDEAYTRRGDLTVSDSGLLTTGDGHPVLGENGPLTIPPADKVSINADGSVWMVPAGGDANQPQLIDRLKLTSPTGSDVVKHVDGLFRVRGGGALPSDPDAKLTSGSLEGSNVNATTALVDMIDAQRAWDTQVKLLTTARDLDSETASLMKLPN